jgi:hypothetical protein
MTLLGACRISLSFASSHRLLIVTNGSESLPRLIPVEALVKKTTAPLNNLLVRSLDRGIGGGSTEVRGVEAIIRVREATVTLDTQIGVGVNGSDSRALGNGRRLDHP